MQGETIKELKTIATKLTEEKGKLTDEYFQSTSKAGLDAKKTELQGLQASYMAKHATLKLNLLLAKEKEEVTKQKSTVIEIGRDVNPSQELEDTETSKMFTELEVMQTVASNLTFKVINNSTLGELELLKENVVENEAKLLEKINSLKARQLTKEHKIKVYDQEEEVLRTAQAFKTNIEEAIQIKIHQEEKVMSAAATEKDRALEQAREYEKKIAELTDQIEKSPQLASTGRVATSKQKPQVTFRDESDDELLSDSGENQQTESDSNKFRDQQSVGTGSQPPPKPKRVNPAPLQPGKEGEAGTCRLEAVIQLKLETIQLPTFGGDLTEWMAFKHLFQYLVHENCRFSDTLKFHQLRSKLRGPALDTIRGYQITGTNHQVAWEDLKRRYDRKDELIQEYIRKFQLY